MNDNRPPETLSEIQLLDGDERLTILCSRDADVAFIEMAARLLRANPELSHIEMQDLDGSTILAYRGDQPEGMAFRYDGHRTEA